MNPLPARLLIPIVCVLMISVPACEDDPPPLDPSGGTSTSLAETPRENYEAEVMALYLSGELVAPSGLYDELLADLTLIRESYGSSIPEVEDARFVPPWVPGQLIVKVTEEAVGRIRRGEYTDLDALNSVYHVAEVDTSLLDFLDLVLLRFEGRLHPDRLSEAYEPVSSVVYANPNHMWNNTYNIYPHRTDGDKTYLFRYGWGDCPAGCIDNRFWYFRAREDSLEYVGTYHYRVDPEPAWWREARAAYDCYPDCPTG